jgi:hypothetical protein
MMFHLPWMISAVGDSVSEFIGLVWFELGQANAACLAA